MDTKEVEFRLVIPKELWDEELEDGGSEDATLQSMVDGLQSMMQEGVEVKLLRAFNGETVAQ